MPWLNTNQCVNVLCNKFVYFDTYFNLDRRMQTLFNNNLFKVSIRNWSV